MKSFCFINSRSADSQRGWEIYPRILRQRDRCLGYSGLTTLDPDGRWKYECICVRRRPKSWRSCRKTTRKIFCHRQRTKRKAPNSNDLREFAPHRYEQHRRASCDDRRMRSGAFESRARSTSFELTSRGPQAFERLFQPERQRCLWFRRGLHLRCIFRRDCRQDSAWICRFEGRGLVQVCRSRRCTLKSFRRSIQKWRICCRVKTQPSTDQPDQARSD